MSHVLGDLTDLSPFPLATASNGSSPASQERRCGWIWLLILTGALALIWWWLRKPDGAMVRETEFELPSTGGEPDRITLRPAEPQPMGKPPVAEAPTQDAGAPASPDDLTRIRGIGPKIARLLEDAGMGTYAALADADIDNIRTILGDTILRLAAPETWPEQARLAAAGQWEALGALQAQLKTSRHDGA